MTQWIWISRQSDSTRNSNLKNKWNRSSAITLNLKTITFNHKDWTLLADNVRMMALESTWCLAFHILKKFKKMVDRAAKKTNKWENETKWSHQHSTWSYFVRLSSLFHLMRGLYDRSGSPPLHGGAADGDTTPSTRRVRLGLNWRWPWPSSAPFFYWRTWCFYDFVLAK